MYKLLLILKYLRKRRIAWVSLVAVTLCTMMVLVIISVMGGWLRMFRESFHGLSGDIIIGSNKSALAGFGHYEEIIQEVQKLPEVETAVPTIHTYGVVKIAETDPQAVQVLGYPIDRIGKVNGFPQSLYLQYQQFADRANDPALSPEQRQREAAYARQASESPTFALLREVAVPLNELPAKAWLKVPAPWPKGGWRFPLSGPPVVVRGHGAWFDADALTLHFHGIMSEQDKADLLAPVAGVAAGSAEEGTGGALENQVRAYRAAVEALYGKARQPARPPQPFRPPEDAGVELKTGLPAGVVMPVIGRNDLVYDPDNRLLIYHGMMTGYERRFFTGDAAGAVPGPSWMASDELLSYEPGPAAREFAAAVDELDRRSNQLNADYYRDYYFKTLPRAARPQHLTQWPGMVIGVGLLSIKKGADADRNPRNYTAPTKLTVVAMNPGAAVDLQDKAERSYFIVDDSRTKVWQYDTKTVYVPFEVIQADLKMDARPAEIGDQKVTQPARASEIYLKLKDGADLNQARDKVEAVVRRVCGSAYDHWAEVVSRAEGGGGFEPDRRVPLAALGVEAQVYRLVGFTHDQPLKIETWEQANALWLGAIEKEKVLVVFLFGIVSLVSSLLVFCIFFMIVAEKTRDIGIIKSVGATNGGVAGIFLGYGLAIGIVGAGLGLLLAWMTVHNINQLHEWMAQVLHIQIWNPEVYQFESIPNTMDPVEASVIVGVAIVFAVLGSIIPAVRAARLHPVEALRWE